MPVMYRFNGLLEAYSYDEADDDGGNMDEEVAPGVRGAFGGMDFEHRVGFLSARRNTR